MHCGRLKRNQIKTKFGPIFCAHHVMSISCVLFIRNHYSMWFSINHISVCGLVIQKWFFPPRLKIAAAWCLKIAALKCRYFVSCRRNCHLLMYFLPSKIATSCVLPSKIATSWCVLPSKIAVFVISEYFMTVISKQRWTNHDSVSNSRSLDGHHNIPRQPNELVKCWPSSSIVTNRATTGGPNTAFAVPFRRLPCFLPLVSQVLCAGFRFVVFICFQYFAWSLSVV